MNITIWGSSHGYAEKNRFTSSTIIETGGFIYLLDAGAPVEWLMVNNDKLFENIRGIFITHMHNDHVGSLSSVIEPMLRFHYNDKSSCMFPTEIGKEGFVNWLKIMGVKEEKLRNIVKLSVAVEGKCFDDGNIAVYAKATEHLTDNGNKSYSYIFEADGKRVLFTGDMKGGFPEYSKNIENESFDLVVCEMAHSNFCDVAEMLKKTNTKKMVITHYSARRMEGYEDIIKTFPFPVEIAKDGYEITL